MPLCWTHSPTPYTSGSEVRSWSSTTMARSTASPHSLPSSALGRMPAEITTMSAGTSVPSPNFTPVTRVWPSSSFVTVAVFAAMPIFAIVSPSTLPPDSSS